MALIQCIECKKEISDTRDECIHCGMKIKSPPNLNYVTCSECGRKIDNSKDECMHCGMRIKDFSRDESIKYRDNWIDPRVLIKNSENKYEKDKGFVWKEETLKENNNDKINPSELIKEFKNNYKSNSNSYKYKKSNGIGGTLLFILTGALIGAIYINKRNSSNSYNEIEQNSQMQGSSNNYSMSNDESSAQSFELKIISYSDNALPQIQTYIVDGNLSACKEMLKRDFSRASDLMKEMGMRYVGEKYSESGATAKLALGHIVVGSVVATCRPL